MSESIHMTQSTPGSTSDYTRPRSSDYTRRDVLKLAAIGLAATAGVGAEPATRPIDVAVLLAEHNTLIDFAGPWEVLSSAVYASCPGFNVYSVAASRAPVLCDDGRGGDTTTRPISGLSVVPDYTFKDAPQPRVILVGGQSGADEPQRLEWLRHAAAKTDFVTSVCTGAFVLGKSGLLNGRNATTNRNAYDSFEKAFPAAHLVRGVRFVESGSIVTATGLTAGIDLALHLTEKFWGREAALKIAEYEEWPRDYRKV